MAASSTRSIEALQLAAIAAAERAQAVAEADGDPAVCELWARSAAYLALAARGVSPGLTPPPQR